MDTLAARKKQIEKEILDLIVSSLREEKLKVEEPQKIAQFVLDYIDDIKDQPQLIQFLEKLVAQWPIFDSLLDIERGKTERVEEVQAAKNIANLIKSGKTSQALDMAQNVIEDK